MTDFNLFEFQVTYGEATFGFGKAYLIGGENMDELLERTGNNPHRGVKSKVKRLALEFQGLKFFTCKSVHHSL